MTIRTARPDEIPDLYTTSHAERDANTASYLARLLDTGCVKPEWCFLSETDGRVTGSVALWTMPGHNTPSDLVLLDTDWDRTPETGQELLGHALAAASRLGAGELGHVVDTPAGPPQHQTHAEIRHELLALNGFVVTREGRRWEWRADDPIPKPDERLTWRSLAELGAEPFLALLTELLADTRDSLLRTEVEKLGLRGAAEELWKDSLHMEHEDTWFELGFDADGTAAAVSLPSRNSTVAVISFVGVLPRHRGKGYATSAVVRGTRILAGTGAEVIRGDCDTGNPAMVRGFERGGYRNFVNRKEYQKQLG